MKAQCAEYLVGLLLLCFIATVNATTPLWLLFMNSCCDGEGFESSSVLPAVEMAIERINRNPSLLPGYPLNLTVSQQVCSTSYALCIESEIHCACDQYVFYRVRATHLADPIAHSQRLIKYCIGHYICLA